VWWQKLRKFNGKKENWTKMTENKIDCLLCGAPLVYLDSNETMECHDCHRIFSSNVRCENGHYFCDTCHSQGTNAWILQQCLLSVSSNPIEMAINLMDDPRIKMHGPEHHFLVPAVLWTAYANVKKLDPGVKSRRLSQAKQRAETVVGGSCGFYGNCGAAVGTGIFISLVTGATPLSTDAWGLCNLMTSHSLLSIANVGGPRCCKRDSFLAISTAAGFLQERLATRLEMPAAITCHYSHLNRECKKDHCPYYSRQ
jgi:hypothetical protein